MNNALRSNIQQLASTFAAAVVTAIRGANLEDILSLAEGAASHGAKAPAAAPRGRAEGRRAASAAAPAAAAPAPGRKGKGRLRRRSPEDIAQALTQVVTLVKKKGGLRAEQIREALNMEAKEMPRILKEGLATKVLKSKGQKRSTTYTAA